MIMTQNVIIYTTPTCVYCEMAKRLFKEHSVKYREVDVTKDPKAAREMVEKSGQMGVPVIEVDGQIIVGFNKSALIRALRLS